MMTKNSKALDFLLTRRSHPSKTLKEPAPSLDELNPILTAAMRSPDHGKLEPWRFIVLQKDALLRLAKCASSRSVELDLGVEAQKKVEFFFSNPPLSVAVVSSPKESEKIPMIEQTLSAGAVCLALVNAALASGWGASWLTGWTATDRPFLTNQLNLDEHEFVAGYIHLGSKSFQPPERPRPDFKSKTSIFSD